MALERLENLTDSESRSALDGIYGRAMRNVNAQHPNRTRLATKVLTWPAKARRPMTVEELRMAVAVEAGQYDITEQDMPHAGMLIEVCTGLVVIEDTSNTMQLAHYSVQQYLMKEVVRGTGDFDLAFTCIMFLSLGIFSHRCGSLGAMD